MKKKRTTLLICALALGAQSALATPPCDPTREINASKEGQSLVSAMLESAGWPFMSSSNCRSILAVLRMATSSKMTGGSQLKTGSGPDPAAAQAEIDGLRGNGDFGSEYQSLSTLPPGSQRLMLEAALFHRHGAYTARDLRIEQARAQGGKP